MNSPKFDKKVVINSSFGGCAEAYNLLGCNSCHKRQSCRSAPAEVGHLGAWEASGATGCRRKKLVALMKATPKDRVGL
jgi:hypothetical protein